MSSGNPQSSEANSSLAASLSEQASSLVADVQRRTALATKVAKHFDSLAAVPEFASDGPTSSLLARISAEVTHYVCSGFTPSPSPSSTQTTLNGRSPTSPSRDPPSPRRPVPGAPDTPDAPVTYAAAAGKPANPSSPQPRRVPRRASEKAPGSPPADSRVMIRLAPESVFRTHSAAECLSLAQSTLGPHASTLRAVQFVPSGLALVPSDTAGRATLLNSVESLKSAFKAIAGKDGVKCPLDVQGEDASYLSGGPCKLDVVR